MPDEATHLSRPDVFGPGAILYGGNFAVRAAALEWIGRFHEALRLNVGIALMLYRTGSWTP